MPIGKNAIKRVENGGYSKVQTSAPDMENSSVVEASVVALSETTVSAPAKPKRGRKPKAIGANETLVAEKEEKREKPVEKKPEAVNVKPEEPVKSRRGRPPKSEKPETQPKPEETKADKVRKKPGRKPGFKPLQKSVENRKNGFERIEVGTELPYWLL